MTATHLALDHRFGIAGNSPGRQLLGRIIHSIEKRPHQRADGIEPMDSVAQWIPHHLFVSDIDHLDIEADRWSRVWPVDDGSHLPTSAFTACTASARSP